MIGPFWLLLTPMALMGIYWLIFGKIFGVEWKIPHNPSEHVGFLLPFFVGLLIYLTVSDLVNSSSVLFAAKRTYVVKSPFPIWVLWVANLMRAGIHATVLFGLLVALAVLQQRLTVNGVLWVLPSLVAIGIFMCGTSLLLASLGPFIGDISEAMRLVLRVLFYATPITYPITLVPEQWRDLVLLNPLASMVEILRLPIVFGTSPAIKLLIIFSIASIILLLLSVWIFKRVKGVISDVV